MPKRKKLPLNPSKGDCYEVQTHNPKNKTDRIVGFEATGKKKFGKWKVFANFAKPKKPKKYYGKDYYYHSVYKTLDDAEEEAAELEKDERESIITKHKTKKGNKYYKLWEGD